MTTWLASEREPLALVAPPRHTALTYVRGALFNPVSLSVMAFAICVGVGYAGLFGAIVALIAYVTLGTGMTRSRFIRQQLDHAYDSRVRQRRDAARMRTLKPSGPVRQQQYIDLRDLVAEIERTAPSEARRFELEELLDQFVNLAAGHQRCLDALRLAGGAELPRTSPSIPDMPARSLQRRSITARRMRHRDACVRQIERLADELEAIDELVRLVAQRVACPHLDGEIEREIERRLWELDAVDAALAQLSA